MASDRISIEELVQLAIGEASASDKSRLEAIVAADPAAAADLHRVRAAFEALITASASPPDELVAQVKGWMTTLPAPTSAAQDIVAQLLFDSQAGPMAGYRGAIADRHLMFRAGDAELDIQMVSEAPQDGRWRIVGQLDATGPTIPSMVELLSKEDGEPLARTMIGLHGGFSLHATAGRYVLKVTWPGGRIVIDDLNVP